MNLKGIQITFNTHNHNKNDSTILHVFVKNRRPDTSTPMGATDYIANDLAYGFNERLEFAGINQFLGRLDVPKTTFDDPSTHTFDIALRSTPIPNEEIFLPVIDIHILTDGDDQWIFSYTVTFLFDDGSTFSFSSNSNGATGIILDQNNHDYSGICVENPFNRMPEVYQPQSDMVLYEVVMRFLTHDNQGDNKNANTTLNVHIVNRLNATTSQDIVVATNLLPGQEFVEQTVHDVIFSASSPAVLNPIRMQDIVLPQIFLNIGPQGDDRWIFDYEIYFRFRSPSGGSTADGRPKDWWTGVSHTNGVILDQDNHKFADVYNGAPIPTMDPLGPAPLGPVPADYPAPTRYPDSKPKRIYLHFLQQKLDDFINNRQNLGSQYPPYPPIRKIRLDNVGRLNSDTLPESYYDLQSIEADPPPPGTIVGPDYKEPVTYRSAPTSLGQQTHSCGDVYLDAIVSKKLTAKVDTTLLTPLFVEIDFDCSGPHELVGGTSSSAAGANLTTLTITLHMTLTWDKERNCVDLMSWVPDITSEDNLKATLGQVIPGDPVETWHITGQFLGKAVDASRDASSSGQALDDFRSEKKNQVIDVQMDGDFSGVGSLANVKGIIHDKIRDQIFDTLSKPVSPFGGHTLREQLNSTVNSWLLGGALATDVNVNRENFPNGNCAVTADISYGSDAQGQYIELCFNGPSQVVVSTPPATWPPPDFTPGTLAKIDHIVVLTMENRSFDHMLGYLSLPPDKGGMGRTDVDGLHGGEINHVNGMACPSVELLRGDTVFQPDPPHSWEPVTRAINGGKMDGFAQSYYDQSGMDVAARIMGYHTAHNVPVYDALARDFAICHRWFATLPGPTFPNRYLELTGLLNYDPDGFWETEDSRPLRAVFTATIFDYLTQYGVSWKYFEHYYCALRFFQSHTFDSENIKSFDDPIFGFENLARNGALPSVSFIDPHFIELPPDANADGPPADIQQGQELVRKIVNAVVASPTWSKTLLIITYDEHGGFYDHVPPPATSNSPESERLGLQAIGTYGVRVPCFIISPLVEGGTVVGHDGLHFDHTSILKTITRRFMSDKPPYLGPFYADANDLSAVIGSQMNPSPFRPFIPYTFVYGPSKMCLEVQDGATSPGAILWQYKPNESIAQQFSFEDAGNGNFYIRTHTGSLYVTATQTGVIQDLKYPPGTNAGGKNADAQRWTFSLPASQAVGDVFTISNAAFPGLVLQPAGGSNSSGVPVVLAKPTGGGPVGHPHNLWQVTSPLISTALTH